MRTQIARTVLATVVGGPLSGLQEAGNAVVDALLDRSSNDPAPQKLLSQIERGLNSLARGDGVAPETVDRAMDNVRLLLAKHGLTAAELAELDLDPNRATQEILQRGSALLDGLDDADLHLTRSALTSVYEQMLSDPDGLPGLSRAVQQVLLERTTALDDLPAEARRLMLRSSTWGLLRDPRRTWRPDILPPSALLRAEYAIVPFQGRHALLDEFGSWAAEGPPVALRLLTGAGGMGKTRFTLELCRRLTAQGWRAGFLARSATLISSEQLSVLRAGHDGVLIVVDYAETRRSTVWSVVEAALEGSSGVRVLLLARSVSDWWYQLTSAPGQAGDFLHGPVSTTHTLPPLAPDEPGRRVAVQTAADRYAELLGTPAASVPGDLTARFYDRVLFLHLKALATVRGAVDADSERGLLDFALRRERSMWDDGVRAAGLPQLAGRAVLQAAAVTTLAGRAGTREEAIALLRSAPLLRSCTDLELGGVAEMFHAMYPSENWLTGVQPDPLGEHLVARAIDDDQALLEVFGGA
jgi:hypothetical protein